MEKLCLSPFIFLLACLLAVSTGRAESLVLNGDFEASAKEDWPDHWGRPKTGGTWEQESGNHFLRLTSTKPGEMVMLYQLYKIAPGTQALELSWRERVAGLKVGSSPWFDARIMLEFRDAAGKNIADKPSPPYTQTDTAGWVGRKTAFLVPEGAQTLMFMPALFQVKAGTFDLDDVDLSPVDSQPLRAAAANEAAAQKKMEVTPELPDPDKAPKELHAEGNRLVDSAGKVVWLQGVNLGGLETLPQDKHPIRSCLVAIDDWKANAVRLPINEMFWNGRSPYQQDGGKAYREAVDEIVTLASNRGAYVVLDLHRFWAPKPEHIEFWKEAATHFKNNPAVLFDLFNEPHDISWEVWRNGGEVSDLKKPSDEDAFLSPEEKAERPHSFHSPGMQALLDAVRSTGANNLVVAGGLSWSGDLSGVTKGYALTDKDGNGVMYSWHIYNWHLDWAGRVLAASEKYPIFVGEVGADIKKMPFIPAQDQEDPATWVPDMLGFIQQHHLNWTAWCLHPQATPVLITDWNYTPSPFWGGPVRQALAGKQFSMQRTR